MVVLIMANINCLVILICSIVFVLSSFVSSQPKLKKTFKDPWEFYYQAVYLRNHYPQYYAEIYPKLSEDYNRIVSAPGDKRNPLDRKSSINNGQFKKNTVPKNAGTETVIRVPNVSPPPHIKTMVKNHPSMKTESKPENFKLSRSLDRNAILEAEDPKKDTRESLVSDKRETDLVQEWKQYCYDLGYNNSNNVCQLGSDEKIKMAPNVKICQMYFEFGCQYRSNAESCRVGVSEVIKSITFNCSDINIGINPWSFQCCMACKGGINTATAQDNCDMHLDRTLASAAQEFCCNKSLKDLNENKFVTTTELIATSAKPESMEEILAHLDERLSSSTTFKSEIDNPTTSATSPLPTTTTTTTTTTTATIIPTTATLPTSTQAATLHTTDTSITDTTTTSSTTTALTSTTTEPTTTTTTTTSPTTTASPSPSTSTLSTTTDEMGPSNGNLETRRLHYEDEQITEGYKPIENESSVYEKIDAGDRSKPDYLVILNKTLKIENDGSYKSFKLMNLTLRSNNECNWEFNVEKVDAEPGVKTLSLNDFEYYSDRYSFIVILNGTVKPQFIQYSITCDFQDYKYYKYIVYLTFISPTS